VPDDRESTLKVVSPFRNDAVEEKLDPEGITNEKIRPEKRGKKGKVKKELLVNGPKIPGWGEGVSGADVNGEKEVLNSTELR